MYSVYAVKSPLPIWERARVRVIGPPLSYTGRADHYIALGFKGGENPIAGGIGGFPQKTSQAGGWDKARTISHVTAQAAHPIGTKRLLLLLIHTLNPEVLQNKAGTKLGKNWNRNYWNTAPPVPPPAAITSPVTAPDRAEARNATR